MTTARKATEGFRRLLAKKDSVERSQSLRVELFLWLFIGAITFTGSVHCYGNWRKSGLKLFGNKLARWPRLKRNRCGRIAAVLGSGTFNNRWVLPLFHHDTGGAVIGYHLIMVLAAADMPVVVSMLNSFIPAGCSGDRFQPTATDC